MGGTRTSSYPLREAIVCIGSCSAVGLAHSDAKSRNCGSTCERKASHGDWCQLSSTRRTSTPPRPPLLPLSPALAPPLPPPPRGASVSVDWPSRLIRGRHIAGHSTPRIHETWVRPSASVRCESTVSAGGESALKNSRAPLSSDSYAARSLHDHSGVSTLASASSSAASGAKLSPRHALPSAAPKASATSEASTIGSVAVACGGRARASAW